MFLLGEDGGEWSYESSREDATSSSGLERSVSGVSQNMYMYPSSSALEIGFESSERRAEVVAGVRCDGIRERKLAV